MSSYTMLVLAASGESVQRAAHRLRCSVIKLTNSLCGDERYKTTAETMRDFLRAMNAHELRMSAWGLLDIRMSFFNGFLSLTATYPIAILQLTNYL
ncbi:hypothetical protein EVAR_1_1 [Eumeta japonica]|uniref:Gustatory receptor n=1 Tax=Eumeta variegata TaxID=151549 RepID=A0A4C1S7J8_EUMVA|nr:hypothetical protein EVAR_1_1 [Eumeta japonica]